MGLIRFNRAIAKNRNKLSYVIYILNIRNISIIIEYEFLTIMTGLFTVIEQMLIITDVMHRVDYYFNDGFVSNLDQLLVNEKLHNYEYLYVNFYKQKFFKQKPFKKRD